jgi:hypothetical protein
MVGGGVAERRASVGVSLKVRVITRALLTEERRISRPENLTKIKSFALKMP